MLYLAWYAMTEAGKAVVREATAIKVRPDLWKEAKIEAIKHDKTVSELVEEAIEAWIKENKKK